MQLLQTVSDGFVEVKDVTTLNIKKYSKKLYTTFARDITSKTRYPHVHSTGRESERVRQNSRAATTDGTLMIAAEFAAIFRRAGCADSSWKDSLDVLPEQVVESHVKRTRGRR